MPTVVKNKHQYCLHDRLVKLVTECLTILNAKARLQCGMNKLHEVDEMGSASVHPVAYRVPVKPERATSPTRKCLLRKKTSSKKCSGVLIGQSLK